MKEKFTIKKVLSKLGPLLALVVVIIALSIFTQGKFIDISNIMNVLRQTPIIAIMSLGMLCVILLGGIDLSAGSLLALAICSAGVIMQKFSVHNAFLLFIVCILVGTLAGAFNGILLTKLHLPHPFIATLGMKNICRGLALFITGATAIAGFPDGLTFAGTADVGGQFPVSFLVTLILFAAMHIFLTRTGLGRKIYSFGGNREAARLAGINTDKVQIFCYAASGFFCAVAGIIFMGRLNSAVPLATQEGDLDAIASCIIGGASFLGGKGNVWGTLIGALMIAVIRNGCDLIGISSDLQQIVIGAVIIVAVFIDVTRSRMEERAKRLAVAKNETP